MNCPHCGKPIDAEEIIRAAGQKWGKIGGKTTGKAKARTSEQARAAVKARWDRVRANAKAE